jgi:hypothetical protein
MVQDHPVEYLCQSLTGPWFPRDNKRPQTKRHRPCSSHSSSWLVYTWWKLEESPISILRMSTFLVFFLLILVSSLPGDSQVLDCDSCMYTTWARSVVTKTLVFHTYYYCSGTVVGSCATNIPPIQCAFLMVSISVLSPSNTLGSNG